MFVYESGFSWSCTRVYARILQFTTLLLSAPLTLSEPNRQLAPKGINK